MLKSQLITTTSSWTVPAGVSCVIIARQSGGGGGGGASDTGTAFGGEGGGGGGAGEFVGNIPLHVTPGGTLSIVIGSGGNGANGTTLYLGTNGTGNVGQEGGTTTCGPITTVGGWGGVTAHLIPHDGHHAEFSGAGGFGGGAGGGVNYATSNGVLGTAEGKWPWGGGMGGYMGSSNGDYGFTGATCEGNPASAGGLPLTPGAIGQGGGGGGGSPFGTGGAGGNYNQQGNNSTSPGGGGGGAGGWWTGELGIKIGGNGASGAVLLMWAAP